MPMPWRIGWKAPAALKAAPIRYAHRQLNQSALPNQGAVKSIEAWRLNAIFAPYTSLCRRRHIGGSLVNGAWAREPGRYLECLCMEGASPDGPGS